ncbi:class I lanthipeptide [Taibaiella chishuiensis]|uniref:Uncharacterized protein n=1 Tax=Taibaiella chishuiensis TaxID=1434707 RepID=A0A2P8CY14_9BACT|nr:class I lanthipeptide [Taibaiella chishuiensis]PSK89827.1 hypothetical protein B0I18_110128 [Taibaiella chishuiensis]
MKKKSLGNKLCLGKSVIVALNTDLSVFKGGASEGLSSMIMNCDAHCATNQKSICDTLCMSDNCTGATTICQTWQPCP